MRVKISETVEVSDEQRVAIAALLDKGTGKKRQATREECRSYIWNAGSDWEILVSLGTTLVEQGIQPEQDEPLDELADLI